MTKKSKFIKIKSLKNKIENFLLVSGKKRISEKLILTNIKLTQKHYKKNHKDVFKTAIINSLPIVNIKKIKQKRKQVTEIPFVVKKKIRIFLSIKSILRPINSKFVNEIVQASKSFSRSVNNKKNIHEHAFLKKKFAHYRWF